MNDFNEDFTLPFDTLTFEESLLDLFNVDEFHAAIQGSDPIPENFLRSCLSTMETIMEYHVEWKSVHHNQVQEMCEHFATLVPRAPRICRWKTARQLQLFFALHPASSKQAEPLWEHFSGNVIDVSSSELYCSHSSNCWDALPARYTLVCYRHKAVTNLDCDLDWILKHCEIRGEPVHYDISKLSRSVLEYGSQYNTLPDLLTRSPLKEEYRKPMLHYANLTELPQSQYNIIQALKKQEVSYAL